MNERARALAILKQARDLLTDRLTSRIVESHEAILEDAAGMSYTSELEAIYDQVGARLVHVNALLANLPASDESSLQDATRPQQLLTMSPGDPVFVASTASPHLDLADAAPVEAPASFQSFVQQVVAGEVDAAGATLAGLLELEQSRAARCAQRFHERLTQEPDFLTKAMQLRHALRSGSANDVLMMLWECFGLQGVEAVGVYQTLQSRARMTDHG
ncbi:MAG: hypothetical protein SGJ19_18155 [Planctomycetia bacterium]|nr:hypothetical protein [Planctomycetia bacterium]